MTTVPAPTWTRSRVTLKNCHRASSSCSPPGTRYRYGSWSCRYSSIQAGTLFSLFSFLLVDSHESPPESRWQPFHGGSLYRRSTRTVVQVLEGVNWIRRGCGSGATRQDHGGPQRFRGDAPRGRLRFRIFSGASRHVPGANPRYATCPGFETRAPICSRENSGAGSESTTSTRSPAIAVGSMTPCQDPW